LLDGAVEGAGVINVAQPPASTSGGSRLQVMFSEAGVRDTVMELRADNDVVAFFEWTESRDRLLNPPLLTSGEARVQDADIPNLALVIAFAFRVFESYCLSLVPHMPEGTPPS